MQERSTIIDFKLVQLEDAIPFPEIWHLKRRTDSQFTDIPESQEVIAMRSQSDQLLKKEPIGASEDSEEL